MPLACARCHSEREEKKRKRRGNRTKKTEARQRKQQAKKKLNVSDDLEGQVLLAAGLVAALPSGAPRDVGLDLWLGHFR